MRFVLEVQRHPDGIRGSIAPEGEAALAFDGWLELIHLLDDRPDTDAEETHR